MEKLLLKLPELYEVKIEKRPSQYCKTPYMADAIYGSTNDIEGEDGGGEGDKWLIHTPSLGCCGLVEKGSSVLVQENTNKKTKSSHSVQLSLHKEDHPKMGKQEVVIGVHPQLAETIVKLSLEKGLINQLRGVLNTETQKTYNESRLDFYGRTSENQEFYLEVKTVPLANYVDAPNEQRKKGRKGKNKRLLCDVECDDSDGMMMEKDFHDKIAYFPDGYRKNPTDVVSPRALKHVKELQQIVENTQARGILCFVVQREDASIFQPSNKDPIYRDAVYEAYEAGVEVIALQVRYTKEGECYFHREMPVRLCHTLYPEKEHLIL